MRWLGSAGRRHFFFLAATAWLPLPWRLLLVGLFFFLPLAKPWRLTYNRNSNGKANTLVGAQRGKRSTKDKTTQSWPQEKTLSCLAGEERVVVHTGTEQAQTAFAAQSVVGSEQNGAVRSEAVDEQSRQG